MIELFVGGYKVDPLWVEWLLLFDSKLSRGHLGQNYASWHSFSPWFYATRIEEVRNSGCCNDFRTQIAFIGDQPVAAASFCAPENEERRDVRSDMSLTGIRYSPEFLHFAFSKRIARVRLVVDGTAYEWTSTYERTWKVLSELSGTMDRIRARRAVGSVMGSAVARELFSQRERQNITIFPVLPWDKMGPTKRGDGIVIHPVMGGKICIIPGVKEVVPGRYEIAKELEKVRILRQVDGVCKPELVDGSDATYRHMFTNDENGSFAREAYEAVRNNRQ